jgi:hypothetical protein
MRNGRDRRSENPFWATAKKERVVLFGTDQRITSGPAAKRLHSKAGYMAAPERFAESQILFPCTAGAVHTWPMSSHTAKQHHTRSWGHSRHGGRTRGMISPGAGLGGSRAAMSKIFFAPAEGSASPQFSRVSTHRLQCAGPEAVVPFRSRHQADSQFDWRWATTSGRPWLNDARQHHGGSPVRVPVFAPPRFSAFSLRAQRYSSGRSARPAFNRETAPRFDRVGPR